MSASLPKNFIFPRMAATLTVPIIGTRAQRINEEPSTDAVNLVVRPKSVRLEQNDHNHADSCTLVADWMEVGVDARMLDNAVVQIFLGKADALGNWEASKDCRFIGLVKDVSSSRNSDTAAEVTFDCVDYTTLFIEAKPFGSKGIPKLDQTLDAAWRTIVAQTPGAQMFLETDRLVLEGLDAFPSLGKAVADRFKTLAYVPTHPETDAWAVWQQCVGMCGLISYIRGDICIVTTATNLYTETDSPIVMWGQNIAEWGESRHSQLSHKGVGVESYNALTGTTLEAVWPPIGDVRVAHKRINAKKKLSQEKIRQSEERDWFAQPGFSDEEKLEDFAKRVWEERSRQELEGHVKTGEMSVVTESGADFDLLSLYAGDSVKVIVDPQNRQLLAALPTDADRLQFLTNRGYSDDAAALIVRNMADFASLEAKFLTKSVVIDLEITDDGGSFSVEFDYINRIQIDGSAVA